MKRNMKKVAKFAGAVCAATGVVALSAVVASGAAVHVVKESFKTAKETAKKLLTEEEQKAKAAADDGRKAENAADADSAQEEVAD